MIWTTGTTEFTSARTCGTGLVTWFTFSWFFNGVGTWNTDFFTFVVVEISWFVTGDTVGWFITVTSSTSFVTFGTVVVAFFVGGFSEIRSWTVL